MGSATGERVTVLITGAGRGLGLSLVRCFVAEGMHVIAACRNPELAKSFLPLQVEVHSLDLRQPLSIDALAKQLRGRGIDYLINNAAIRGDIGGLSSLNSKDFLDVMTVNALAPLLMVKALLPHLMLGQRRVIANISSRAGSISEGYDPDGDYAYRCSKAALNMATTKLAQDSRGDGLTALSLHPGWVKTDMGGGQAEISPEKSAAGIVKLVLSADQSCSGSFRSYDGTPISW
jgi:NAD(P)-dependent dehydrogenase (short-subunit alcohol dehydrogenase family)